MYVYLKRILRNLKEKIEIQKSWKASEELLTEH